MNINYLVLKVVKCKRNEFHSNNGISCRSGENLAFPVRSTIMAGKRRMPSGIRDDITTRMLPVASHMDNLYSTRVSASTMYVCFYVCVRRAHNNAAAACM